MQPFKLVILLVTLYAALVVADPGAIFEKAVQEHGEVCMKEHGVQLADMEKLKNPNLKPSDITDNMKCTLHCFLTKVGVMDDNGKPKTDAIRATLNDADKKRFDGQIEKCQSLQGASACDTTFIIFGCLMAGMNAQ